MSQRRETIHLSLGSSSNAVTAHLLNLQGLAATGPSAPCDPNITHTVQSSSSSSSSLHNNNNNVWVPRVLMVDEPIQFQQHDSSLLVSSSSMLSTTTAVPTWSGKVQEVSPVRGGYGTDPQLQQNFELFHERASMLAYSSHSRYQVPSFTARTSTAASLSSRHVNWEEHEEEDEQDEEEDDSREFRQRRLRQQWHHNTEIPVQEALNNFWEEMPSSLERPQEQQEQVHQPIDSQSQQQPQHIPWRMYWMPPYPKQFAVSLPYSSSGTSSAATDGMVVETWDTFMNATTHNGAWKEDELKEQLRHVLEDCDSLQGVTMITQGHGIYAGLATELLQELQDECRTAGRFCIHVVPEAVAAVDPDNDKDDTMNQTTPRNRNDNDDSLESNNNNTNMNNNESDPLSRSLSSITQPFPLHQQQRQLQVRDMLQHSLTLHGLASHSHLVLPVTLRPSQNNNNKYQPTNVFLQSAQLAMALENATLPYRLDANHQHSHHPSIIGLNSYYTGSNTMGEFPFGTASSLSFGEFMACLQPSPQYRLLELDASMDHHSQTLIQRLHAGTSFERDSRMRQPSTRGNSMNLAGAWLQNDAARGGIMTSFSPHESGTQPTTTSSLSVSTNTTATATDRSLHHHFALAASFRPADDNLGQQQQQHPISKHHMHVKSLMEGMGIGYRPDVSMACVLEQSVGQLTSDGYGAGSYWHAACGWKNNDASSPPNVLSVLSNTSRVYPRLYRIAKEAKDVLQQQSAHRYRGYYNRDVQHGLLPEREDCDDAINYCLDLRDLYHPPEGSGLVMGDD